MRWLPTLPLPLPLPIPISYSDDGCAHWTTLRCHIMHEVKVRHKSMNSLWVLFKWAHLTGYFLTPAALWLCCLVWQRWRPLPPRTALHMARPRQDSTTWEQQFLCASTPTTHKFNGKAQRMLKKCNISWCIREDRESQTETKTEMKMEAKKGRRRGQWVSVNGFGSALAAADCATHTWGVFKLEAMSMKLL